MIRGPSLIAANILLHANQHREPLPESESWG